MQSKRKLIDQEMEVENVKFEERVQQERKLRLAIKQLGFENDLMSLDDERECTEGLTR